MGRLSRASSSLSSSAISSSVSILSSGSKASSERMHSSGRGGSGNIRRASFEAGQGSQLATLEFSVKAVREEHKDGIIPPKGRELVMTSSTPGIKSSGRGGSGNIGVVRKAFGSLQRAPISQDVLDAMEAREREVLAAHKAKKQAKAIKLKTSGRGGLGNLTSSSNSANRKQKAKQLRYSQSVSSLRRSVSTSSSGINLTTTTHSTRSSVDIASIRTTRNNDVRIEPVASTSASTSSFPVSLSPQKQRLRPTTPTILSENSGKPLATKWNQLFLPSLGAASVTSKPASMRLPAGGGGEWRLVTHVREERHGRHQVFIEEQGWEYSSPVELERERTTSMSPRLQSQVQSFEMKVLGRSEEDEQDVDLSDGLR